MDFFGSPAPMTTRSYLSIGAMLTDSSKMNVEKRFQFIQRNTVLQGMYLKPMDYRIQQVGIGTGC